MDDPDCVAVVGITPGTKRQSVCEHHEFLRLHSRILEIIKDAGKVCATTTLDIIVADVIQVIGIVGHGIVAVSIKSDHMDFITLKGFHDALDLAQEVFEHFVANGS